MRLNCQNKSCAKQRGLSLIELLISLFLSSLVIVALFSFFSNFKANAFLQGSIVDNQHELRFISDFIRSEVHKAGYQNEEGTPQPPPNGAVSGNATSLTLAYQSDGTMRDCVGATINANAHASVQLTLVFPTTPAQPGQPNFGRIECRSSQGGTITLLDNVSLLEFEYLNDGATSYSTTPGTAVVAVKFRLEFNRRLYNSEEFLQREYTQVAARRNTL